MTDEELIALEARLNAVEKLLETQGTGVSNVYLLLQKQLDELALQVEAQNRSLQRLLPEFETHYGEVYSELRKKRGTNEKADYDRW